MFPNYRKTTTGKPVLIVHRRKGRSKIKSNWDYQYGWPGKWATLCGIWTHGGINVSVHWHEVTCMKCLKRGGKDAKP